MYICKKNCVIFYIRFITNSKKNVYYYVTLIVIFVLFKYTRILIDIYIYITRLKKHYTIALFKL